MMSRSRSSILLLCDDHANHASTVLDHIDAFLHFSCNEVYTYNPRNLPFSFFLDLNEFGAIVIHYSLPIISDYYLSRDLRRKIHEFQGLKIQYIQDDYRQVKQYTDMMKYLGINILFTPYPAEKIPLIYDEKRLPGVRKISTLTGYVPDRHTKLHALPFEKRPVDVGYRGRDIPYWLGILSQEKAWIGEGFLNHIGSHGLKCDIAWKENDRVYGEQWDYFISSCRAMLGTESGASITDFDGSAEMKTKEYLAVHPHADFWEVYENVLKTYEGNLVENTVSPRVFECAAHRTAMILFPGEYSGLVEPWVHYIPLQKDFSNMEEVVAALHDTNFLKALTERAYNDLIGSGKYSYQAMIQEFDQVIEEHLTYLKRAPYLKIRFWLAQNERLVVLFLQRLFGPIYSFLTYAPKKVAKSILPKPTYEKLRDVYRMVIPDRKL